MNEQKPTTCLLATRSYCYNPCLRIKLFRNFCDSWHGREKRVRAVGGGNL